MIIVLSSVILDDTCIVAGLPVAGTTAAYTAFLKELKFEYP